jgi:pyrimidine-nucleoside phosphorylase
MVKAQGGDVSQIEDLRKLPQAKLRYNLRARESGCLAAILADRIAWTTLALGAGRRTKEDEIDHAVGIEVHGNVGDAVAAGDLLMTIHANDESSLQAALDELDGAVAYSASAVEPLPLFHGVVDGQAL